MHRTRRIVVIAGEPGIGKTRLAQQFARELRAAARRPARALLGGAARAVRALRGGAAPGRRRRRPAPGDEGRRAPAPVRRRRRRARRARRRARAAAGARRPALGRPRHAAAHELPAALAARPGRCWSSAPTATRSSAATARWTGALADLRRDGALDRVGLRGLARGRRRRARPRRCWATTTVAARVHARTDGNAFFVEEVLRGLAESRRRCPRACARRSACASSGSATPPTSCSPPPRCSASNSTRRAGRHRRARARGRRGRARRGPARAAAAPRGDRAALRVRARARARGGLRRANVLRRARLHRRAAEALSGLGEDRHLEEIATHLFEAAAHRRRAARGRLLTRAGRRALDRLAYEDAAERFDARARGAGARGRARRGRPGAARPRRRAAARRRARAAREAFTAAAAIARRRARRGAAGRRSARLRGSRRRDRRRRRASRRRLEEALELRRTRVLRSRAAGPPRRRALLRARPRALGGAQRRGGRRPRAQPATPWRWPRRSTPATSRCGAPDRIDERLAVAAEMIAAARDRRPRGELQARNWRVAGPLRARRHGRVARRGRAATPGWPTSCDCRRSSGTRRCGRRSTRCSPAASRGRAAAARGARGGRARGRPQRRAVRGDARVHRQRERRDFVADRPRVRRWTRSPTRRPGPPTARPSPGCSPSSAATTRRARSSRAAGAGRPRLRRQLDCPRSANARARPRTRRPRARGGVYDRLAPYAGRPITAGRAVASYGAADRHLGELAACSAATPTPSAISVRRSRSTRRWAPPSGPPTAGRRYRHCGPRARALRADVRPTASAVATSERVRRQPAVVTGRVSWRVGGARMCG